jgi:hypothetical protein
MSYLVSLKIQRQKFINDSLIEKRGTPSVAELLSTAQFKPKIERYNGRGASENDGYWILLQDWSDCSVKCGGGYSLQQWLCVPPKKGGKTCIGEALRKRECNNNPCPIVDKTNVLKLASPDTKTVVLKPIFKALPYSKRPQQFVKCVIKENDVLYKTKEYDPERKNAVKVPGRIVMNPKTISVYKDDGFNNILFSFPLDSTTFSKSQSDYCCFYLTNANRQFEMCGFNQNCGTQDNPIWVAKWGFDFDLFKAKCFDENVKSDRNLEGKKNPDQQIPIQGLMNPQQDLVDARTGIITKKIEDENKKKLDDKVASSQKIALTALRRELNLEDMIKKEEIQKGKEETAMLYQEMEQEKKKKDLLDDALKARKAKYGQTREVKNTEKLVENIKSEAKIDIKFKRSALKKKIMDIRNKFRRKHRQIKQEIQMIRSEIANDIVSANKEGNMNLCKENRSDVEKIKSYCNNNITTDYAKNQECKDPGNFCYICCATEFGDMHISKRDECESMCDDLERLDLKDGDWVFNESGESGSSNSNAPNASNANADSSSTTTSSNK